MRKANPRGALAMPFLQGPSALFWQCTAFAAQPSSSILYLRLSLFYPHEIPVLLLLGGLSFFSLSAPRPEAQNAAQAHGHHRVRLGAAARRAPGRHRDVRPVSGRTPEIPRRGHAKRHSGHREGELHGGENRHRKRGEGGNAALRPSSTPKPFASSKAARSGRPPSTATRWCASAWWCRCRS